MGEVGERDKGEIEVVGVRDASMESGKKDRRWLISSPFSRCLWVHLVVVLFACQSARPFISTPLTQTTAIATKDRV